MIDIGDNTTNGSDSNNMSGHGFLLYLTLSVKLIMSLAIITSASIVLLAIKKSKRDTRTLHFFFIANLMITDIGVAVIQNGLGIVNMMITIVNPTRKGIDCRIIAVSGFPYAASSSMLAALCCDYLYSTAAPNHYRRNMTKRRGCVIASLIWLISFALNLINFLNPHISNKKTRGAICLTDKNYALTIITVCIPLVLSVVFAVIQRNYFYHVNTMNDASEINNTSTASEMRTAWKKFRETQKASKILLILSVGSAFFGIINPVIFAIVPSQVKHRLTKVIVFSLVTNLISNFNILFNSLLYGYFLHYIRESLGFNICLCFRSLSEQSSRCSHTNNINLVEVQ